MKRNKIVFVYLNMSTFVSKDLEILRKHFDVKPIQWTRTRDVKRILKIMKYVYKTDLSFITFADRHAVLTIRFSKLFRKKSVVVVGGYDVAKLPEIGYGLMISKKSARRVKYVLEKADKVLTINDSLKINAINNAGVDGQNIQTVHRGYESNKWKFEGKKEDLVMTVSVVNTWNRVLVKGVNTFVKSTEFLPNVKFIVIGLEGEPFKELKSIAPPNVEFIGFLPNEELLSYYQKAKVYCQLSRYEGFGNALSEAMLCECVPVGTKSCELPIGNTGFYVPYGDPKATADAIKEALKSKKGKAARERIMTLFPLEKREENMVKIINALVKKK